MSLLKKNDYKLWLIVTLVFIFLSAAWTGLIIIAKKNEPQKVEIQNQ